MNVELAQAAIRDAKASPERFDMSGWFDHADDDAAFDEEGNYVEPLARIETDLDRVPPCGTTACFAGFVAFQTAPLGSVIRDHYIEFPDDTSESVQGYATKQLGITHDQSEGLFFLSNLEQVEKAIAYLADNPDASEHSIKRAAGMPVWWL